MPTFQEACETLFAHQLGHGRRWKTAAAHALGIGRATLYRYFENEGQVAGDVWRRLRELSDVEPVRSDREMVTLFARGLLDLQAQVDRYGWVRDGYPPTLQRSFDLAAARNAADRGTRWPTDLEALSRVAREPIFEWVSDLTWDPDGEYTAARLIEDGEVSPACIDLALPGKDPEAELTENEGFRLLRSVCHDRSDGDAVYAAFRRVVIERPVLSSLTSAILTHPVLSTVERIDEIVEAFYQRVPEAMAIEGVLPTCLVSGTILRRQGNGFHTESRDPDAVRLAKAGESGSVRWRPGTMQLRRPFRLYWCLPGKTELDLAGRLETAGWACTLWPNLDRVDLAAVAADGRRIAVDVKDYLSPENLAVRFQGFKEYASDHTCFLVVPDYLPEVSRGYVRRFEAVRAAYAKGRIELRTVGALLSELGAGR